MCEIGLELLYSKEGNGRARGLEENSNGTNN